MLTSQYWVQESDYSLYWVLNTLSTANDGAYMKTTSEQQELPTVSYIHVWFLCCPTWPAGLVASLMIIFLNSICYYTIGECSHKIYYRSSTYSLFRLAKFYLAKRRQINIKILRYADSPYIFYFISFTLLCSSIAVFLSRSQSTIYTP